MVTNRCHDPFSLIRFFCDMTITSVQVLLFYFLGLLILGFTPIKILSGWQGLIFNCIILASSLSVIHHICCRNNKFFRKFGFLLPGDVTYYIFVHNKRLIQLSKSIDIKASRESECISDKDNMIQSECSCYKILSYNNMKFAREETKCFTPMLHVKAKKNERINRKIIPPKNRLKNDLEITWYSPDNVDFHIGNLERFNLLFSKNVILILYRAMMIIFLILILFYFNFPLQMIVEPQSISENTTEGTDQIAVLSIKNIGCELRNMTVRSSSEEILSVDDNKWKSGQGTLLPKDGVESVRLKIIGSTPGDYRGFIIINGSGFRRTLIDSLDQIPIKKEVYVPFKVHTTKS